MSSSVPSRAPIIKSPAPPNSFHLDFHFQFLHSLPPRQKHIDICQICPSDLQQTLFPPLFNNLSTVPSSRSLLIRPAHHLPTYPPFSPVSPATHRHHASHLFYAPVSGAHCLSAAGKRQLLQCACHLTLNTGADVLAEPSPTPIYHQVRPHLWQGKPRYVAIHWKTQLKRFVTSDHSFKCNATILI